MFIIHEGHVFCQTTNTANNPDSVEISLLTCKPRPYIYSLYGHTAIRYQDKRHGVDLVVNYGTFSFDKPFFILRFVLGLTDYEMGIENFEDFKYQYAKDGCGVIEQTLNLSPEEKNKIASALGNNYKPENRVYRYNYFYDNCTTRARDIIVNNVEENVVYTNKTQHSYPSYRQLIHKYNETHRWARFGNDLLLGVKADLATSYEQQQFLPDNLCEDFDKTYLKDIHNKGRRLVKEKKWLMPPSGNSVDETFPLTPRDCMLILACIIIATTILEIKKSKVFWQLDIFIMLMTGLCGLILFTMVFSQHPTVSLNFQILLLNPLNIIFLWPTTRSLKKGEASLWLKVWTVLIIIFLLGGILQDYAEGLYLVALSLLFRNIFTIRNLRAQRK